MNLVIGDEQEALVEMVRQWLRDHTDLARVHTDHGDATLVRPGDFRAAAELGLVGLLRRSEGGTHADLALVVEELGHAASPLPLGEAGLVCRSLDDAGLDREVADQVAAGSALVVPVAPEPGETVVEATVGPDGALVLHGRVPVVAGGLGADRFLVTAVTGDGSPVLALVASDAPGLRRTPRTSLDITRDFAAVAFDAVQVAAGRWRSMPGEAPARLTDALALHHVADALGAADRLLGMTVQYVRERQQFGRAVGGFQAVKHLCANMALDVECARVTVRAAAQALNADDRTARRARIAAAGSVAGEACSRVAGTALQLHGGMGFTWEHNLHLYLRRIKTGELLGGTPRQHRARLLDDLAV